MKSKLPFGVPVNAIRFSPHRQDITQRFLDTDNNGNNDRAFHRALQEEAGDGFGETVATVMDILDASNLKNGTVTYKKDRFDFKTAVLEAVEDLRPSADEKNLIINVSISDEDFTMEGDEEKLKRHAVRNLIDNAIKYTPKGAIHVDLFRTDGHFRFSVQDEGVGVTTEDMSNLFTEGGKGKDSVKVNVHSTGYGLYIAKKIVEAHGGRIWAESEGQGKGSRFIVELPAV